MRRGSSWGDGDDTEPRASSATSGAAPLITSVGELREASGSGTIPIHWVGARNGTKLELTPLPDGTTFVRYLPSNARAGDPRRFLTVATYPREAAFAEMQEAIESTSKTIRLAGGGLAVYDPAQPTNVHLAYPGQPYQIEVFAPERGLAPMLVSSGAVRPV